MRLQRTPTSPPLVSTSTLLCPFTPDPRTEAQGHATAPRRLHEGEDDLSVHKRSRWISAASQNFLFSKLNADFGPKPGWRTAEPNPV